MHSDTLDAPFYTDDGGFGLVDAGGALLSDPAAEAALIGVLLLDPAGMIAISDNAGGRAFASNFRDPLLRRLFEGMFDGFAESMEFSIASVTARLGLDPKGKLTQDKTLGQYLAALMAGADTAADPLEIAEHLMDVADTAARNADADVSVFAGPAHQYKFGPKLWTDQNDPGQQYDFLVEDLIPFNENVLIMGESQTGKSFLAQHLCMCGARAVPFFGRRILQKFGTIWLAFEAARGQTARMRAYNTFHGIGMDPQPFAVLTRPMPLWPNPDAAKLLVTEMRALAAENFGGIPHRVVVIDTYNAATPGASEIDSEVVSRIRGLFDYIRDELNVTVIIVGHTNALGKHRGNEQLTNNIDTVIQVSHKTRPVPGSKELTVSKDDDARGIKVMKVKKQREGEAGAEVDFVLHVVGTGQIDAYGKERTSCVITEPKFADISDSSERPGSKDRDGAGPGVPKQVAMFMECVLKALDDRGVPPPAVLGLPRSVTRVVDYDFVKHLMSERMLDDGGDQSEEGMKRHRGTAKAANRRARETLMHLRIIGAHNPYVWWTGKPVRGVRGTQAADPSLFDQGDPLSDDIAQGFTS